jgi:hypothetical protein
MPVIAFGRFFLIYLNSQLKSFTLFLYCSANFNHPDINLKPSLYEKTQF